MNFREKVVEFRLQSYRLGLSLSTIHLILIENWWLSYQIKYSVHYLTLGDVEFEGEDLPSDP